MALTAEEKLDRKRFNKRLEMLANYLHATGLAVLGFGVIRYVSDITGPTISLWQGVAFALGSLALEGLALYILGYLRSEE